MSKNSLQKEPTALTPFMLHLILPTEHRLAPEHCPQLRWQTWNGEMTNDLSKIPKYQDRLSHLSLSYCSSWFLKATTTATMVEGPKKF